MSKEKITVDIFKKTIYYAKDKDGNTYGLDMTFIEEPYSPNVTGYIETIEEQVKYVDGTYSRETAIHKIFHPNQNIFFWQANKS